MGIKIETLRRFIKDANPANWINPSEEKNPKKVTRKTFLAKIKKEFKINLIYYPGSGDDFDSLEGPFYKKQIVYVDKDEEKESRENTKTQRNLIRANPDLGHLN